MVSDDLTFDLLVGSIRQIHEQLASHAGRAVNISLTLRNWMIGCYIAEYEQSGKDRAEYATRLLANLSSRLVETGMDGVATRSLRQYRQFYLTYPRIWQTPSAKLLSDSGDTDLREEDPNFKLKQVHMTPRKDRTQNPREIANHFTGADS